MLHRQNQSYSCVLTPSTRVLDSKLAAPKPPKPSKKEEIANDEPGDVKFLRSASVTIDSRPFRAFIRGDLHQHTEFSTDGGGSSDGSVPEFACAYADRRRFRRDFGAVTDHSTGGDVGSAGGDEAPAEDQAEMHQIPGRYLALFGDERSATYPNGHRNVIQPYRNIPIVKYHFRADVPEYWSTYEGGLPRALVDSTATSSAL